MRTLPAADAKLYGVRDRTVLLKVTCGSHELTKLSPYNRDWVESVSYSANLDQPLATAEIRVLRDEGYLSMAPLNANSRLNNLGGTLAPVITLRALVVISVAVVPLGHDRNYADTNALWQEVFRGRIDSWDASSNPIVLRCRDISCEVQDLFIERARTYAVGKQLRGVDVWSPGEVVALGEWRVPTQLPELGKAVSPIWVCTTAGTCGLTEPAWSGTVTDGTAVWQARLYGSSGWNPGTAYEMGDSVSEGGHVYVAVPLGGESEGTSGAVEPTWPTTVGASVDDGGVRWIMVPDNTDGGLSIETILAGMLYDNTTLQDITTIPGIWTPTSPGYWRNPMVVQQQSLLEAMRALAAEIGWDVRLRYNPALAGHATWGKWRLCLAPPERTKTAPDVEITEDEYEALPRCESSLEPARTRVRVVYSDYGDLLADGTPKRKSVTVVDSTAEAKFGRRFMEIAAGSSNGVNSSTEATALANAILSDVSDPGLEVDVSGPYRWNLELSDLVGLAGDWEHFTADQTSAIYGYSHELSNKRAKTTLQLRGKPALGVMRWLELQVGPGTARPATSIHPAGPQSGSVTATGTIRGAVVEYKPPRSLDKPPLGSAGPGQWQETELHLSATSGFTPSATTLEAVSRSNVFTITGKDPGVTLYGRLVMRDGFGNPSARSSQFSVTPGFVEATDFDPMKIAALAAVRGSTQVEETGSAQIEFNTVEVDTADGYDTGDFLYAAPADGLYEIRCAVGLSGLANGDTAGVTVKANGSAILDAPRSTVAGSSAQAVAAGLVQLSRGDEITAYLNVTTSSGAISILTTSRLEIRRLIVAE
jgi:hypothetical protein